MGSLSSFSQENRLPEAFFRTVPKETHGGTNPTSPARFFRHAVFKLKYEAHHVLACLRHDSGRS